MSVRISHSPHRDCPVESEMGRSRDLMHGSDDLDEYEVCTYNQDDILYGVCLV